MRTAENQPLVLQLNAGMDQTFGERGAPPGTLYLVKNSRNRSGGLVKRCGSVAFASTNTGKIVQRTVADTASYPRPTEKAALVGRLGTQGIAATTAGWVFSHDGTNFRYAAECSAAQPVRRRFGIPPSKATTPIGPFMPAVAVTSTGYIVTAGGFGAELRMTVESPDGVLLAQHSEAVGAANIVVRAVVISATLVYVIYQATDGTSVLRASVSIATGGATITTGSALVTLANASSTWDLSAYDGTTWFLVYQSGATTVTIAEYTSTTAGSTATFATTDNLTYLSVWADPVTDRIWIGVVDDPTGTPASSFRVYTDALALSVGPTAFTFTGGAPLFGPLYVRSPVAGDAFCVFADRSTGPERSFLVAAVIQAGTKTRETIQAFNVIPVSKPDAQQRVWCMTHAVSNFSAAKVLLLRFAGPELIGEASSDPTPTIELASPEFEAPGATYHPYAQPGRAFNSAALTSESADGKAYFALPFVLTSRTNASAATEPTTRVDVYEYTRYNQEPHRQMVTTGRSGVVSGHPTELYGVINYVSGDLTHGGAEVGFAHGPSIIRATTTPNGSGLAAGSYVYYAIQQWVDDEGNRHLSPPSPPFELTLTVPSTVDLDITNCYVGQRPNIYNPIANRSPETLLYRTQNGGTEAQLVPITLTEGAANWSGYVDASDTVADSIIDDNEFLYTAGGVLPNVLAPSCRYLALSEERLWCGGLWDSNIIECSKVKVPGEPYNFTGHPSHQVVIPGEVSGLAYMDGQVVVFTEDAIYLVSGDGPNDQGAGGFAPPRALVRGVGCPRSLSASILETEVGILFRSTMGFYVIPRGFGTPEHIGDKVRDEDEVVLSAATTTTDEHRLARFLVCASGETKSDTVLTLDLTTMQWFRDEYTVNGSITGQGFSEIGEWPDGLALMSYGLDRTDNPKIIWAEDEDETADAGAAGVGASTYISQYIRTAWIYLAGPLGVTRVTAVEFSCEAIGSSSLVTLTIETDSNASQAPFWTITTSEAVSYRLATVENPTCTCFRLTLQDAAGATGSAGIRMLAIGAEAVPVPGIRRLPDADTQ